MNKKVSLSSLAPVIEETLAAGGSVRLEITGQSMLPLLHEGRDSVELVKSCGELKKYDIPLFGILATSTAVIKNGRVIINSENPTLFDFICTDTHSRELSRAIYEVLGQKMKIAVSNTEKAKAATSPLEDLKNKIGNFNNN